MIATIIAILAYDNIYFNRHCSKTFFSGYSAQDLSRMTKCVTSEGEHGKPRGFHRGSTVIMSGFDPQFSADDCRAFASWFSPVVYVEQLSTNNDKSRFMVVFASNAHVEQLARHREISVDNGIIEVKAVGTDESVWNTMGDMMTYTSAAPILQMAQDGLNAALNQLSFGWGGYLTG